MTDDNTSVYNNNNHDNSEYNNSFSDNSEHNSDTSLYSDDGPHSFDELVGDDGMAIIAWILVVCTLLAIIYGVTSWCLIKKFRVFRNYVILSAIVAKMCLCLFYLLNYYLCIEQMLMEYPVMEVLSAALVLYLALSFHCWLLVLCYIFYVDFVKVFRLDIHRRYLKSTLFGWGLPFISNLCLIIPTLFFYYYDTNDIITLDMLHVILILLLLIPVTINFVIYVIVLYCLFRRSEVGASISFGKWRRFYIASLIFIFSNVIVLVILIEACQIKNLALSTIGEIGDHLNAIALVVYLIVLKSNRVIWREFLNNRSKLQKSLEMK